MLRGHVVLQAVDALIAERRSTLFDVARTWPDAERVLAPLKGWIACSAIRICMRSGNTFARAWRWLVRSPRQVIIIDWSEMKNDKNWHVLRIHQCP